MRFAFFVLVAALLVVTTCVANEPDLIEELLQVLLLSEERTADDVTQTSTSNQHLAFLQEGDGNALRNGFQQTFGDYEFELVSDGPIEGILASPANPFSASQRYDKALKKEEIENRVSEAISEAELDAEEATLKSQVIDEGWHKYACRYTDTC